MKKYLLIYLFLFILQATFGTTNFNSPPTGPPTALTFNTITTSSMTGHFTANGSADGYLVLRRTGSTPPEVPVDGTSYSGTFGTSTVVSNTSSTNFTSSGLAAGTVYYYAIYSYTTGSSIKYYITSSLNNSQITLCAAPVVAAASGILQISFIANWAASTGATAYLLDVSTNAAFSSFVTGYNNLNVGNVISYTVNNNLSTGLTYYYRVRATSNGGTTFSANSGTQSLTTILFVPIASAGTNITQTSFSANWATSVGATNYFLDVSISNTFSPLLTGYNNLNTGNVSTYPVTINLTAGTTYYYRVTASNGALLSTNSSTISVTTLSPVALAASISAAPTGQTSFTANWSAATSATDYRLDIAMDNSFISYVSGFQDLPTGYVQSKTITGLSGGITYYYRIRAITTAGTSGNSNTIIISTIPANPIILFDGATQTSFSIYFLSIGNTDYKLDVSTDNFLTFVSGYNNLSTGSAGPTSLTTFSVNSNISAGTTYNYRVRAVNSSGTSGNVSLLVTTYPPNPVTTTATAITQNSFIAHWNASVTATNYFLDVSSDNFASYFGTYQNTAIGNLTSATITGLTPGTTYQYKVRAFGSGPSNDSNIISVTLVPPEPVTISATAITESSMIANWNATLGAVSYKFDAASDLGFNSFITGFNDLTVNSNSVIIPGLLPNSTYFYRVRALNGSGISSNSNSTNQLTLTVAPITTAASFTTASGFTANWAAAVGANQYAFDIASDNAFNSILPSYNNFTVSGISSAVSGLAPGTLYYCRVRSINGTGSSVNSNIISQITIPPSPPATPPTLISSLSFVANWALATGASSYHLDVSADNFATFVTGYNDLSVAGITSASVTGLTEGINYTYRIRAENVAGISTNSNNISVITIPSAPIAQPATSITSAGFTANWTSVTGASSYLLDVLTDNLNFLAGYNGRIVASSGELVTGLLNGTTYNYRIRASNASGVSSNSNLISQITIPSNPNANSVVTKGSTNFIANWDPVPGASSYELDVSLFTSNFSDYIIGYNARPVISGEVEELVNGLTSGTSYKFRVRAVNAGGKSGNSNSKSVITDGGSAQPISVSITNFNGGLFTGNSVNVDGQIANALGAVNATLVYKGITEATTKEMPITVVGTGYSIPINDTMLDELGMEFFVTAKDETDATKSSDPKILYRTFTDATSPIFISTSFEGTRASIKIISIPLDLKDNLIQSIFISLGAYDKKGWRLAHYQDGQNVEYEAGINKIDRGLGYWFNAKSKSVILKTGEGNVGEYNQKNPFKLVLVQGWNQIGNPFPFDINWTDVLSDNPGSTGVGPLRVYDGSKQNFSAEDNLKENTGGFVFSDKTVALNVEVSLKGRAGRKGTHTDGSDIGQSSWQVPLTITQNSSSNSLGAIGMNPDALLSKDHWDEIRLPRLDEFLDVTFSHPEYHFTHFSKDVVPTANEQSWKFSVESNGSDEQALLEWNNTLFGDNSSQLILFDVEAVHFIDMRSTNNYSFINPGKKEFRIYYRNDDKPVIPDVLIVGTPYPNPSSASIRTTLILPQAGNQFAVEMTVFNMVGQLVKTLLSSTLPGGIHEVNWDGNDVSGARVPSGIYIVQSKIDGRSINPSYKVMMK